MADKPAPHLLDLLSDQIRLKGYSRATERNYRYWVRRSFAFTNTSIQPTSERRT